MDKIYAVVGIRDGQYDYSNFHQDGMIIPQAHQHLYSFFFSRKRAEQAAQKLASQTGNITFHVLESYMTFESPKREPIAKSWNEKGEYL